MYVEMMSQMGTQFVKIQILMEGAKIRRKIMAGIFANIVVKLADYANGDDKRGVSKNI